MSWLNDTQSDQKTAEAIKRGFEVIKKLPPLQERFTKGQEKQATSGEAEVLNERAFRVAELACDDLASRELRAESCKLALDAIQQKYKVFQQHDMRESFRTLWADFVQPNSPAKLAVADRLEEGVPVALLSSCGTSSDPKSVFKKLKRFLSEEKAYTAVLGPEDFETGGSGGALLRVLEQLLPEGERAGAEDVEALQRWYEEETVCPAHLSAVPPTSEGTDGDQTDDSSAAVPATKTRKGSAAAVPSKTPDRTLRTRKPPASAQAPNPDGNRQRQARCAANARRAIVLLVRNAEALDPCLLRDLLMALSENHSKFPASVVLGLTTLPQLFLSSLPCDVPQLMRVYFMRLATAEARTEELFRGVLLGIDPTLHCVASEELMRLLVQERAGREENSLESLMSAVKLSTVLHFMREPMSALAASALTANKAVIQAAVSRLSPDQLHHHYMSVTSASSAGGGGKENCTITSSMDSEKSASVASVRSKGSRGKKGAEGGGSQPHQAELLCDVLVSAGATWARWRLGLLWASCIARCTGADQSAHFKLPALYLSACGPPKGSNSVSLSSLLSALTRADSKVSVQCLDEEDELPCMLQKLQELGEEALLVWPLPDIHKAIHDLQDLENGPAPAPAAAAAPASPFRITPLKAGMDSLALSCLEGQGMGLTPLADRLAGCVVEPKAGGAQEVADEKVAAAAAAAKQKLPQGSAPLSKKGRDAALRAQVAASAGLGAAGATTSTAKPSAELPVAPAQQSLRARVAAYLASSLESLLGTSPLSMPGARAFVCDEVAEVQEATMGSVRASVHSSLTQPHLYLDEVERFSACNEDDVMAYQLVLGRQDGLNVVSWYEEYCHMAGQRGGSGDASGEAALVEAEGRAAGKVARATRRGRQAGGASKRTSAKKGASSDEEEEISEEDLIPQLLEHAARFGQAVNDLQFVGVCRPSKRRKDTQMQRTYFAPDIIM